MTQSKIDFVLIWVDGNDPEWLAERSKYDKRKKTTTDNSVHRYRDWNNLQYWFRGVETFCPWVNKIHFVTWGHLPEWLDTSNPKLNIVKHSDFIPEEYLPTFSSHTIELNLHRIKGLADNFVYFNDDTFMIDNVEPTFFFRNNLPCDSAIMNVHCYNMEDMYIMAPFRDIGVINHSFNMRRVIKENPFGWFNIKYGFNNLRNLILLACPRFPGMLQQHLPTAFKKEVFNEVWEEHYAILDSTCQNRFREMTDVNQWVFKEWQLASGKFYPRKLNIGKSIPAYHIEEAAEYISKQKGKMMCLNDTEMSQEEFERCVLLIKNSFEQIVPKKSSFEK
ncbi:Stealth CR1 domain-containing protein [Streptococcus sp. S784/96/1]|uniref:Stealth CR1 domain-containing protein n=1 Tax=Streptococcus sp. S784/96/1 TaxID=2653499 RepID=UPI00138A437D|nr:Stealth CR1 domain-containing protein [Streptococcus sp. S784/96/1]